MYLYCANNPVNNYDPTGTKVTPAQKLIQSFVQKVVAIKVKQINAKTQGPIVNATSPNNISLATYDLSNGWNARIDKGVTGNGPHIHVYNNAERYAQLKDGRPSHGSKGEPPNSVKRKLREKTGWDWDGNKNIQPLMNIDLQKGSHYAFDIDTSSVPFFMIMPGPPPIIPMFFSIVQGLI
jgi:hypothetical protein